MSVNFSVIHDGVANFQFAFVQRTRRRLKACYSKSVNSFLKITKHLGPKYAAQFKDRSVVEDYHHRPPYPTEVFEILSDLITDEPRAVLDVGCGIGDIARRLVDFVDRIDAVDFSQGMIEKGKRLPGGDHPNLRWFYGAVEEVPLHPPYALVTAGESLHWMEWDIVLSRFKEVLTPRGYVAIIRRGRSGPWEADVNARVKEIISRFSTNQDYRPYNLVEELEKRDLFQKLGEKWTKPIPFVQPLDDYIEFCHSRNGFSRERMGKERAAAFDAEMRELLSEFCKEGKLELQVGGNIIWGIPTLSPF